MPALKNWLTLGGALLGLTVPLICLGIRYVSNSLLGTWVLLVWPSSIMTMAIFHPGASAVINFAISVLVNAALYAGIGRLLAQTLTSIERMSKNGI
jgi:hypothetical protein